MGAKQSKRSVDISGKEAESAGEVAAAGAGGEGRVEQLADVDALKPQLNGDAHIHEQTDKEKELDGGTPENEKDATTEKEGKQEDEKEATPVTNGESEQKVENGDSTPTSDDGKKSKKEKVKKKFSLRSISFSRKDKPKQEKKQKEEKPKTNGEPEKVPEVTAEVVPEPTAEEATEEVKPETKEEKTPETPVTEPITNGSSTPESLKTEITEEPTAPSPEIVRPEPKTETEPEQLPVNGLSLEEPIKEIPEVEKVEESKPEEPTAETTVIVPEIPVKKEVCVDQMPLIEPTPPPLPANPPPSSVASFAATTMAPELADASLANTADTAIPTLPTDLNTTKDNIVEIPPEQKTDLSDTETATTELSCPLKEIDEEHAVPVVKNDSKQEAKEVVGDSVNTEVLTPENKIENLTLANEVVEEVKQYKSCIEEPVNIESVEKSISSEVTEIPKLTDVIPNTNEKMDNPVKPDEVSNELNVESVESPIAPVEVLEPAINDADAAPDAEEPLPSPPPPICDDIDNVSVNIVETKNEKTSQEAIQSNEGTEIQSNHILDVDETTTAEVIVDLDGERNIENEQTDASHNVIIDTVECNGNIVDEDTISKKESLTEEILGDVSPKQKSVVECERRAPSPDDSMETNESIPVPVAASPCKAALPSSDATPAPPQEPLPTSDKIAELIPEIPTVPEITTETLQETTTDVAVAN